MKTLDRYKFGGILADDMGLGKTIQMLSIILDYVQNTKKEERKTSIVISPSSLALNWQNEANKFAGELQTVVINGTLAERKKKISELEKYDLVITSYDLLKRDIELYEVLKNYNIDLIVLAGYLKLIGNRLIEKYKIINTHPSLLPKFGGKGMYGMKVHNAVWEAKEKYSGPTIHFVNNEYDKGNIVTQTKIEIKPTDTPEVISKKVQAIEKIQLIETLKRFVNGEL